MIYFIYMKRFKYLSFEVLNDPNSQESLDLPGFHGRRVSERLHLIDLDGDLTSLGHIDRLHLNLKFLSVSNSKSRFNLVF